jgi:hypothetical protein
MATSSEWYVYAGIGGGVLLIILLFVGLCCWHRSKLLRATGPDETTGLLNNQQNSTRPTHSASMRSPIQEQLLDAESWNRINLWLIDTCRHFTNNDMEALEDADYAEGGAMTPSASYTNRGARLPAPMGDDATFPATPRSAPGLSPRVSVGPNEGIYPSRNALDA